MYNVRKPVIEEGPTIVNRCDLEGGQR